MWTIHLPLRVPVSKKKHLSLNMNQYRNAHYQALNKAKVLFEKDTRKKLRGIPKLPSCTLEYRIFFPSRQLCDTNNFCAIVDKFFSDTLVSAGVIEDDNYKIVVGTQFLPGGIDRLNPRVEVTIRGPSVPLPPLVPKDFAKETKMKIQTNIVAVLSPEDLQEAVRAHLIAHGVQVEEGASIDLNVDHEVQAVITTGTPTAKKEKAEKAPEKVTKPKLSPVPEAKEEPEAEKPAERSIFGGAKVETESKGKGIFANMTKPVN